jgi:hypothetical protein
MSTELYTKEQMELAAIHMVNYSISCIKDQAIEPKSEDWFNEFVKTLTSVKINQVNVEPFELPKFHELINTQEKGDIFMASLRTLTDTPKKTHMNTPNVNKANGYKYLIERKDNHQWFCLNITGYYGNTYGGEAFGRFPNEADNWSFDANQAYHFHERWDAEDFLRESEFLHNIPSSECEVTEHEFVDGKILEGETVTTDGPVTDGAMSGTTSVNEFKLKDYTDFNMLASDCWLFLTDDSRPKKAKIKRKAFLHEVKIMIETAVLFNQPKEDWISIADDLPMYGLRCWFYDGKTVTDEIFGKESHRHYKMKERGITHWKRYTIPKPPQQ